jgi:hypothetical protein
MRNQRYLQALLAKSLASHCAMGLNRERVPSGPLDPAHRRGLARLYAFAEKGPVITITFKTASGGAVLARDH